MALGTKDGRERGLCAICLDELPVDTTWARLDCTHVFHAHCMQGWRDAQQAAGKAVSCPMCRSVIEHAPQPARRLTVSFSLPVTLTVGGRTHPFSEERPIVLGASLRPFLHVDARGAVSSASHDPEYEGLVAHLRRRSAGDRAVPFYPGIRFAPQWTRAMRDVDRE